MAKNTELWRLSETAAAKRILQFAWRTVHGGRDRPKVADAHIGLQKHLLVIGDQRTVAIAAVHAGLVSRKNIGALEGALKADATLPIAEASVKKQSAKQPRRVVNGRADDFYNSWEWTTLRMKVLKTYGRRCMCCGATPEAGAIIQVDHIKPHSLHPDLALDFENMQVLCKSCNRGKGNWSSSDYRPGNFERDQAAWQVAVAELENQPVARGES